jgi:hypothetical protein
MRTSLASWDPYSWNDLMMGLTGTKDVNVYLESFTNDAQISGSDEKSKNGWDGSISIELKP